jgi:acyl carrier protein
MTTADRIKKLFTEQFDLKEEALFPEATLESLGLDSLDQIEFLFALEKEFDISLSARDTTLVKVQDVIDFIERQVAEQKEGQA